MASRDTILMQALSGRTQAVVVALLWAGEACGTTCSASGGPFRANRRRSRLVTKDAIVCALCGSYQTSFQAANCKLDDD
eukprot:4986911-Pyramimonas_sp.AAC.1